MYITFIKCSFFTLLYNPFVLDKITRVFLQSKASEEAQLRKLLLAQVHKLTMRKTRTKKNISIMSSSHMPSVVFVVYLVFILLCWLSLCWVPICYVTLCEYRYAECNYAECHYTECHYTECHYTECHYTECRYTECHFTECRDGLRMAIAGFKPSTLGCRGK